MAEIALVQPYTEVTERVSLFLAVTVNDDSHYTLAKRDIAGF